MALARKKQQTWYDVLNVSPQACDDDIRRAYYDLARKWHPDSGALRNQQSRDQMYMINQAYTFLKTQPQRDAYNRFLERQQRKASTATVTAGITKEAPFAHEPRMRHPFFVMIAAVREIFWPFAPREDVKHG